MVEIEAPAEGRVSHSCLALAEACRREGREWPARAFCGSWLRGSRRDLVVMPLIADKVNCLTWVHSSRVVACGPIKLHTIHIGSAWMHTDCLSSAIVQASCSIEWCCHSQGEGLVAVVLVCLLQGRFYSISLPFRILFKDFFSQIDLIGDGLKWLSNGPWTMVYRGSVTVAAL